MSIQATTQTAQTPAYIEVARSGTTFTTYTSTNGTTWTPIDVSTVTLPNLSGSILAGLAVSSNAPDTSAPPLSERRRGRLPPRPRRASADHAQL